LPRHHPQEVLGDMMRQWKQAGSVGGAFYWPGGGYVYGSATEPGRQQQQQQQQQQGDGDAASGKAGLALDVVADASFYLLYADVPGLAKPDLSIRLSKERRLTISGQRARPALEGGAGSMSERRFGPFSRSWALPDDADADGISAKVADGVLTITVPRKAPAPAEEQQEDDAGTPIDIN
jgi:HSP20 family protein